MVTPKFKRLQPVRFSTHTGSGLPGAPFKTEHTDAVICDVRVREGRVEYKMIGFGYWSAETRVSERVTEVAGEERNAEMDNAPLVKPTVARRVWRVGGIQI